MLYLHILTQQNIGRMHYSLQQLNVCCYSSCLKIYFSAVLNVASTTTKLFSCAHGIVFVSVYLLSLSTTKKWAGSTEDTPGASIVRHSLRSDLSLLLLLFFNAVFCPTESYVSISTLMIIVYNFTCAENKQHN